MKTARAANSVQRGGGFQRPALRGANGRSASVSAAGFTLIELLVVIGIIAVLATMGIGALRGFSATNVVAAGNRQLLDDISMARNHALNQRTTVYMVFVPPLADFNMTSLVDEQGKSDLLLHKQFTNRLGGQFVAYNFITLRSPGDQPGFKDRKTQKAKYLSEWKFLPEGVYVNTEKFAPYDYKKPATWFALSPTNRPLPRMEVPFPSSRGPLTYLPVVAFNYRGELMGADLSTPRRADEILPLTRGSIVFAKNPNGQWLLDPPEVIETPKGNSTNNPYVRVDWLTGRPRIEEPKI